MRDINKVIIIGRLVRNPELKYIPSGTQVTEFSLAINSDYRGKDGHDVRHPVYVNCKAWAKLAEVICEYCRKGMRICVEGRLDQESWDDKETGKARVKHLVVVEGFQFLSQKSKGAGDTPPAGPEDHSPLMDHGASTPSGSFDDNMPFSDNDIPF